MSKEPKLYPNELSGLLKEIGMQTEDTSNAAHDLVKSDALDLTKWISGLVAGGGILTGAGLTSVAAWATSNTALSVTLIIAASVVLVAAMALIGWVVTTDVKERGRLQDRRYAERARITHDYLELLDEDSVLRVMSAGLTAPRV